MRIISPSIRGAVRRCTLLAIPIALVLGARATPARGQAAAPCRADSARTLSSRYEGEFIRAVAIVTSAPVAFPGPAAVIDGMHARTRVQTVRRQLLFAPGETVDTLRVAESLYRLRRARYLDEVAIVARSCADSTGVSLTVVTRDAWSAAPSVKLRSASTALVGLEERNVLGTGRDAKVYVRSDGARLALGLAYTDPWVVGSRLAAAVARNTYHDGADWTAAVGTRVRSSLDPWQAEVTMGRSARESRAVAGDTVRRQSASALFDARVARSAVSATSLLLGAEFDEARVVAGASAPIVGPSTIRREFGGVDIGVARRSAAYQDASWLLPGGDPVDLPVGLEGEAVLGVGRELDRGGGALHADAWLGQFWLPGDRVLVAADAWASGYRIGGAWSAGSARAALRVVAPAARGLWTVQLGAEQLFDPDPDVHALASLDPTLPAIHGNGALAESALAGSIERAMHLRSVSRGYALDLALFGAGSMRWDPAGRTDRPSVIVLGAGLRLAPTRAGRAGIGVSVGYPVSRWPGAASRPFVTLSITPWLESGRMRAGRGGQ